MSLELIYFRDILPSSNIPIQHHSQAKAGMYRKMRGI